MKLKIQKISEAGSCHFCQRGQLAGHILFYPYDYVLVITGPVNEIRICEKCYKELIE